MIIYRTTDQIPVKIGEVTFWLSPLNHSQRQELLSLTVVKEGEERAKPMQLAVLTLSIALKKVDGVQDADGSPYELELDSNGRVTEESINDIFTLDGADKLIKVSGKFALNEIADPKLDGVFVDFSSVKTLKKSQKSQVQKTE